MKNTFMFKTIYCGAALLTAGLLGACDDDTQYDFAGDNTNRVFLNVESNTVSSYNGYTFSITHTPAGSFGDAIAAAFPVRCTLGADADTRVTIETDNTLIEAYNNSHGTAYSAVPDAVAQVSTTTLTIGEGDFLSADSLKVSIPEDRFAQLTKPSYLLPLQIKAVDNTRNTEISTNLNTVYLIIKTAATNCYDSPEEADMEGTLVADRSAWVPTLSVPLSYGSLTNMLNGNTRSYWYVSPAQGCSLTVDLGAEYQDISGIRLHTYRTNYSILSANVSTSGDGSDWTDQGTATLSTASSYQYIKFYAPVTGRYLKLDFTGWRSSSYIIMAEFDVYVAD